ncbi:hypothetical protein [Sunxiuqinia sp. sy24]|uniref:hypothetical protein n=1 Tax=Sunxiuqinia sp. sy24 TaxID=3461495 RepID=UPI00404654B8
MKIEWDSLEEILVTDGNAFQHGLAGPVAGVHQNQLVLAGGSNFDGAMPWQGGRKLYHDTVFTWKQKANAAFSWEQADWQLPEPMAYSACVSTEKGIVSLGGETGDGPTARAFCLSFEEDELRMTDYQQLPEALASSAAAAHGTTLYLAGGMGVTGETSHFFSLNLQAPEAGWQKLPDLPVRLSHAVAACQHDGTETCFYILGGRCRAGATSKFLSAIWKYVPSKNEWQKAGELQVEGEALFGLSAGTGLAYGSDSILLFGGDTGEDFNQTERLINALALADTPEEKDHFLKLKENHLTSHKGFCTAVFCFNTRSGKLSRAGKMAGMTPVTTTAFWWNESVIIPGGEIRPGMRSAEVIRGIISQE